MAMIMAYARLAMACPRIGYKTQQHGLLQPEKQLVQVKLPWQSSSARPFLLTAQRFSKESKISEDKPKESSENDKDKPKECSEDDKDKSKECPENEGNKPKECSGDDQDKPKECSEDDEDKSKQCPEDEGNQPNECPENEGNKPKECSGDDHDKPKECSGCPGAPKMPCCKDPKSVCVDPCEEDEDMEQIAAHIGGQCAKDPCSKVKDPCERFIKAHIGRPMKPKVSHKQQPMAQSESVK